jgi:hypothetical protein
MDKLAKQSPATAHYIASKYSGVPST